ncbi:MAG: prenyltransferase [Acidimicrobiia bacterium]
MTEERTLADLPQVAGMITREQVRETIDAIAGVQQADGNIPWVAGGHTDPWNLVEAAMALDIGRRFAEAERAYEWLVERQNFDGSWHAYYQGNAVKDQALDTNVTSYVASGVWHHYACSGDTGFLEEMFPVVERALDFALDHQHATGEIEWDADPARLDGKGALLTGSSSIYSSLRCAIAAAERLGRERPDWELSLGSLAIAIAHRPERFLDKERWAMDWYYPILGGVLRGHAAEARIAAKWNTFVAPGRGVRCVSDQPWITAA